MPGMFGSIAPAGLAVLGIVIPGIARSAGAGADVGGDDATGLDDDGGAELLPLQAADRAATTSPADTRLSLRMI